MYKFKPEKRISKDEYYLGIAEAVLRRATCLRRRFGAVIVSTGDEVISTGYNGAPRGRKDCLEKGYCNKDQQGESAHSSYNTCMSVHAEMNAIISAARKDMIGGTLFLVGKKFAPDKTVDEFPYSDGVIPCVVCKKLIMNSGIERIVTKGLNEDGEVEVNSYLVKDIELENDFYAKKQKDKK